MDWSTAAATMVTVLIAVGGALFFRRAGGGLALSELQRANRILEKRVHELEASDASKTRRIAELETRTDIALAIVPVLEALAHHEQRAAERSVATLYVLNQIADKIGASAEAA